MKDRNLLIICPSFPDKDNNFYWWIFIKEYINSIKKYFNKVYVISPVAFWLWITKRERNCNDYTLDNIEIYYPRFFHFPIKYFRENLWHTHYKKIIKVIDKKNLKFDIIHTHFTYPSWYAWVLLKETFNKALVTTIHQNRDWFLKEIQSWLKVIIDTYKKSDFLVRVNKIDILTLKKYNENTVTIVNGYDENKFYSFWDENGFKNKLWIKNHIKVILNVWALENKKNQKTLILSCKELLKTRDDFICYIVWEGSLKNELQNLINNKNLQNHVKLLWSISHNKIPEYMNLADIFVLPSLSESFWVVNIEALACEHQLFQLLIDEVKKLFLMKIIDFYMMIKRIIKYYLV